MAKTSMRKDLHSVGIIDIWDFDPRSRQCRRWWKRQAHKAYRRRTKVYLWDELDFA